MNEPWKCPDCTSIRCDRCSDSIDDYKEDNVGHGETEDAP
jgi:hypothetical protein